MMWPFRRRAIKPAAAPIDPDIILAARGLLRTRIETMDDARKVFEAMEAPPGEYMAAKKRLGLVMEPVDLPARMP